MPNVAAVLKLEITRIARKQVRAAIPSVRRPLVQLRKRLAALRRRLRACERAVALLTKEASRRTVHPEGSLTRPAERGPRFTAKGLRSLQRRLRLSGQQFAKLLGISSQAVYAWQRQRGAIRLRKTTRDAVLGLRRIGAREARRRLEALSPVRPRRAARRRRKR